MIEHPAEGEAGSVERLIGQLEAGAQLIDAMCVRPSPEQSRADYAFMREHPSVVECAHIMREAADALSRPVDPPLPGGAPAPTAQAKLEAIAADYETLCDALHDVFDECHDMYTDEELVGMVQQLKADRDAPVRSSQPSGAAPDCEDCWADGFQEGRRASQPCLKDKS